MSTTVRGVEEAVGRARQLASGGRRLLGLTGAPGAGKSTLAQAVVGALAGEAVLVPMDGFHLPQAELERLGRAARKGAPDTFDAAAFVDLLGRVRAGGTVRAPLFDRVAEEPVPDAVEIHGHVPLVVVEGNYLLLDDGPWSAVAGLLDEVWFLETDEDARLRRLVERHVLFGKEPEAARAWALGPDQRNAERIAPTRARADVVVHL